MPTSHHRYLVNTEVRNWTSVKNAFDPRNRKLTNSKLNRGLFFLQLGIQKEAAVAWSQKTNNRTSFIAARKLPQLQTCYTHSRKRSVMNISFLLFPHQQTFS